MRSRHSGLDKSPSEEQSDQIAVIYIPFSILRGGLEAARFTRNVHVRQSFNRPLHSEDSA